MIFGSIITIHIPIQFKAADGNSLHWRHNGRDGVSNHQPNDCLPNRLFRRRSKKTPKLCVTGLCAGNSPVTGEFPAQMVSNAENVPIWWRHHASYLMLMFCITLTTIRRCSNSDMWPLTVCTLFYQAKNHSVHQEMELRTTQVFYAFPSTLSIPKNQFADVIGFISFWVF